MNYLWWTTIALGTVSHTLPTDFGFVTENGIMTVVMGIKETEVTLLLPVKITLDTAKESLATMTAAYNTWAKLEFWVDEELKLIYKKSLETGKSNLQEGAKVFNQLMGYLGQTQITTPTDSCLLEIPLFDGDRLVQGGSFIKQKISQITSTWTPEEVKSNQKKQSRPFCHEL